MPTVCQVPVRCLNISANNTEKHPHHHEANILVEKMGNNKKKNKWVEYYMVISTTEWSRGIETMEIGELDLAKKTKTKTKMNRPPGYTWISM